MSLGFMGHFKGKAGYKEPKWAVYTGWFWKFKLDVAIRKVIFLEITLKLKSNVTK